MRKFPGTSSIAPQVTLGTGLLFFILWGCRVADEGARDVALRVGKVRVDRVFLKVEVGEELRFYESTSPAMIDALRRALAEGTRPYQRPNVARDASLFFCPADKTKPILYGFSRADMDNTAGKQFGDAIRLLMTGPYLTLGDAIDTNRLDDFSAEGQAP